MAKGAMPEFVLLGGDPAKRPLPPHPDLVPWLMRLGGLLVVAVWAVGVIWRDDLLAWAAQPVGPTDMPIPFEVLRIGASVAFAIADPQGWIRLAPMIVLSLIGIELGWSYLHMHAALKRGRGSGATYGVRSLHPANRTSPAAADPLELWRAFGSVLRGPRAQEGRVAFLITRQPNQPARLGVYIRGETTTLRLRRPTVTMQVPVAFQRLAQRLRQWMGGPIHRLAQRLRQWMGNSLHRCTQRLMGGPLHRLTQRLMGSPIHRLAQRLRPLPVRERIARWHAARQQPRTAAAATAAAAAPVVRPTRMRARPADSHPPLMQPRRMVMTLTRRTARGSVRVPALPLVDGVAATIPGVAAIRRSLEGALKQGDETVMVEACPDLVAAAAETPHTVLFAHDVVLAASAHLPLLDDESGTGGAIRSLMRGLAVPNGVMVEEVQVLVTPAPDATMRRWYQRGRRLVARLRTESMLGGMAATTSERVKAKLNSPLVSVTLRFIVVARSSDPEDLAAARESLQVLLHALAPLEAQYQLGSHVARQRLMPAPLERHRVPSLRAMALIQHVRTGATILAAMMSSLALGSMAWAGVTVVDGGSIPIPAPFTVFGMGTLIVAVIASLSFASLLHVTAERRRLLLARVPRLRPTTDPIILPTPLWFPPALMSLTELARLWALPAAQSVTEAAWIPNRIIPAPASAFVPDDANLPDDPSGPQWLTVGHAYDSGGALRPVGVPLRALHQMMHITAGMGAGKSQAAAAMCHQLIPHGFIILDGKGDDAGGSLASVVRRLIPPEDEHRLFYLNVLETAYPIGLNPIYHYMVAMEQATTKPDRDLAFNGALGLILGLFERLDPGRWGESPGMQQYAMMGCHLVLRTGSSEPGSIPTMAKVAQALDDAGYRNALLDRYPFKTDVVYRFWTEREEQLSETQRSSLHALLRRLDLFMANPITRPMLTVERPSVDLLAAMDTGQIVIIPMPHRTLGGLGPLVGMLILQSVVAAAYARPGDAMSRVTAPVFIDEVQVFVVNDESPDLEQAFTQLRGFGVPLIVLHQTLDQLGALESTFTINAANRLILRTGEPDASTYAKMYSQAGLRPEDIKGMEALNHQYAVTLGPAREQLVFSLRPNGWPDPVRQQVPRYLGVPWAATYPTTPVLEGSRHDSAVPVQELDQMIAALFYREMDEATFELATTTLAQTEPDIWDLLLDRWEATRAFHGQYLLDHPGAIPDPDRRQTMISNLRASRGAVVEETLILRQTLLLRRAEHGAAFLANPPSVAPNLPQRFADPAGSDAMRSTRRERLRPDEKAGISPDPVVSPSVQMLEDDRKDDQRS